jgi:hypothetical protein
MNAVARETMGVTKSPPRDGHLRGHDPRRMALSTENPSGPGSRGPYNRQSAKTSYEERLARRQAPQPECKCGCGELTPWLTSKCRWATYAKDHYRTDAPYKNETWLRAEYLDRKRTQREIADECGVYGSTVAKFMRKFDIPARDRSEARVGRKVGASNPSWKGGVADWDYAAGWKVIARKIRGLDEWTCQLCHEQRQRWGKHLHVHHIDGDKLNNDPLNLISVCASCHPRGAKERELAPMLRAITAQRKEVI